MIILWLTWNVNKNRRIIVERKNNHIKYIGINKNNNYTFAINRIHKVENKYYISSVIPSTITRWNRIARSPRRASTLSQAQRDSSFFAVFSLFFLLPVIPQFREICSYKAVKTEVTLVERFYQRKYVRYHLNLPSSLRTLCWEKLPLVKE